MKKAASRLGVAVLCAATAIALCLGVFYVKYWGFHAEIEEVYPWALAAAILWVPFLLCILARVILLLKIKKEQDR